jgi:hypothetical protein
MIYMGNYLNCQGEAITVGLLMETKKEVSRRRLPLYENGCGFEGYDPASLMTETAKLRNLITKRERSKYQKGVFPYVQATVSFEIH